MEHRRVRRENDGHARKQDEDDQDGQRLGQLGSRLDLKAIQKLGLTGPMSQKPIDFGFPLFNMSGAYSNLGPPTSFPQKGPFDTYFLAPTFTWVRGKHALKRRDAVAERK